MLKNCLFQFEQLLVVFQFTSLGTIPEGITSSAVRVKICGIAAGIKTYKSILKKKKKKHDKIVLFAQKF